MSGFPRLYAIVDRATLDARGMGVGEFARELRAVGVRLVQYRDKENGAQEILRAAREIDEAFEGVDVMRIMNDRADLAVLAGWEGVHVGQGDLRVEAARRVFDRTHHAIRPRDEWGTRGVGGGEGSRFPSGMTERKATAVVVGVSTHSEEQVRAVVEQGSLPDYVAVGPVFGTVSKANAEPVVGLELVRRVRGMTGLPIVAIGGITLGNARSVMEAGADAVAVIGGLFVEGRTAGEVARDFLEILG